MVEIKIVKTKKQIKEFVKFVDYLYSDCKQYCPCYQKSEHKLFSHKKNPSLVSNEIIGFLAYQEGKVVGRTLGIINRVEKEQSGIVRFSHFDFINDTEVSFALLNSLLEWAKTLGATSIVGALNFNDLGQIGMVYKNSSQAISTYQQGYNYSYYLEHLKAFGFTFAKKYNEYSLTLKDNFDLTDVKDNIYKNLSKAKLRLVEGSIKFKVAMYARKIFDLMYENSISSYPLVITDKVYLNYLKTIKNLFESDDLIILINDSDEVVGSMLITKNTSLGLQTTMGRVFVSKTMYTVGGEYKNEHDISWMISNKNYNKEVMEIFSGILAEKFETNDYYMIFSNLWINSDTKKQAFENYFNFNLLRSRLITSLNLKNNKISGVVREKEEFCVPTFKTNKSELS